MTDPGPCGRLRSREEEGRKSPSPGGIFPPILKEDRREEPNRFFCGCGHQAASVPFSPGSAMAFHAAHWPGCERAPSGSHLTLERGGIGRGSLAARPPDMATARIGDNRGPGQEGERVKSDDAELMPSAKISNLAPGAVKITSELVTEEVMPVRCVPFPQGAHVGKKFDGSAGCIA